ncbi:MAG: GDP-mannose 4,6-dehydratase [Nanoarchaeota archaeon]|nr:GDP-mannose 4,6-dehydratase [Nanoarchaeota archaeon]MBU1632598.1 GDP-mannose 4,6-dehydratase [Nanoarchaeota archaeon]
MKCLVTGISGFVGGYLTEFLIKKGYEVYGIDQSGNLVKGAEVLQADILDKEKVFKIIKDVRPNQIIHLAAQSSVRRSWDNPELTQKVNVDGTRFLLDAVREAEINSRILIVTSAEIYGVPNGILITENHSLKPVNPYGESRLKQEKLIEEYKEEYNMDIVISRSFPHMGPKQLNKFVCSSFAYQIAMIESGKQEPVLKVGNLEAVRDFTDVRDIVKAYYLLINSDSNGVYNICSGNGISISEVLKALLCFSNRKINVKQDPNKMRPSDIPVMVGNNSKFVNLTDWIPIIPIEETLKNLLDYWRKKAF